jgi:hypothetical protein
MNTTNLYPDSIVSKTGIYYCSLCKDGEPVLKNAFSDYAKKKNLDNNKIEDILVATGISSNYPITKKRFNSGDKFDECPRHNTSTMWIFDKEDDMSDSTPVKIKSEVVNTTVTEPSLFQDLIELHKKKVNWFAVVEKIDNERVIYDKDQINDKLYKDIIEGHYPANTPIEIHSKNKDGIWNKTNTSLTNLAKSNFKLGVLYRPVNAHAMAGLKYGALAGIILKLLDTFILLFSVDPTTAVLFLAAIGVCFIPRVGVWLMIGIGFLFAKLSRVNLFIVAIVAALVGSMLGCLPGMFIGGIIGVIRKSSIPRVRDTVDESSVSIVLTILLPALGGCGLILFYIFIFNPWLVSVL